MILKITYKVMSQNKDGSYGPFYGSGVNSNIAYMDCHLGEAENLIKIYENKQFGIGGKFHQRNVDILFEKIEFRRGEALGKHIVKERCWLFKKITY